MELAREEANSLGAKPGAEEDVGVGTVETAGAGGTTLTAAKRRQK